PSRVRRSCQGEPVTTSVLVVHVPDPVRHTGREGVELCAQLMFVDDGDQAGAHDDRQPAGRIGHACVGCHLRGGVHPHCPPCSLVTVGVGCDEHERACCCR